MEAIPIRLEDITISLLVDAQVPISGLGVLAAGAQHVSPDTGAS